MTKYKLQIEGLGDSDTEEKSDLQKRMQSELDETKGMFKERRHVLVNNIKKQFAAYIRVFFT